MTTRKTRATLIRVSEEAVFGYRPPSAGSRMNSSDEPDDDDLLTDDEPSGDTKRTLKTTLGELKKVIRLAMK